jgi:hypothetical protein
LPAEQGLRLCPAVHLGRQDRDEYAQGISATGRRLSETRQRDTQAYAKAALAELASEFRETADKIEQRVTQEQAGRRY